MKNFEIIQKLFANLKCSKCDNFFTKDAVELLRKEENNVVVRVVCSYCHKNFGLAILGVDNNDYKNSLKFQDKQEEKTLTSGIKGEPITYEEVAEAHNFFHGLEADWAKYLPKQDDGS